MQNGCHFADDSSKCIFLNENIWISIEISLMFVPKGPINNNPASVAIMTWCLPGDKPLSQPMMVRLLTHICITRPQWVKKTFNYLFIFSFEKSQKKQLYSILHPKKLTPGELTHDTKQCHRFEATLVQVIAHCMMARSHYLTKFRLNVNFNLRDKKSVKFE